MNFFEQELRKLVSQSGNLDDPRYVGRACYGRISDNIRAKLQFVTMGTHEQYEALKTTLLNNTEGEIDSNIIRFRDIWGAKPVSNPNFPNGVVPKIWKGHNDYDWYVYKPDPADYETLADSVDEYLEMFNEDINYGQSMT